MPTSSLALRRYADFGPGCPQHLADAIRYSLFTPGKRLRPILVLLAAKACGGNLQQALPAACAIEMIHTYSLIHDDLPAMDDDDTRRGLPTCHIKFGEATAILAGDALQPRAFESWPVTYNRQTLPPPVVSNWHAPPGQRNWLVAKRTICTARRSRRMRRCWMPFIDAKRAPCLSHPCGCGGLVAQADVDQLEALTEYGIHIGLAFQIIDDLLDAVGKAEVIGKRTQKDANRGKTTYPALYGIEASQQKAASLMDAACAALTPFGQLAEGLENLARYVVSRAH